MRNVVVRAAAIGSAAVIAVVAMLLVLQARSSGSSDPSALPVARGEAWIAVGGVVLVFVGIALVAALVIHLVRSRRRPGS